MIRAFAPKAPQIVMRRFGGGALEADLIQAARDGDRTCFDLLVQRHGQRVHSFIAKRLKGPEADDTYQDTLLAAWRAMSSYEGRSEFKTWLTGIAQFKIQDHYRRNRVTTVTLDDLTTEVAAPDRPYELLELAESMRPILESLGSPRAEILQLYYGQRLTFEEIAQRLGKNASTIKYHFYQAHEAVAAALKGEANDAGKA